MHVLLVLDLRAVIGVGRDHCAAGRVEGIELAIESGDIELVIDQEHLGPDPVLRRKASSKPSTSSPESASMA